MYEITKHLNAALGMALDDMEGSENRVSTIKALFLNHEEKIKELEKDRDGWIATTKESTEKCFKLKEANAKLKTKSALGEVNAKLVIRALFGNGYKYVGISLLRENIKEKMDRHERTKEGNVALKRENEKLSIIRECYSELKRKFIEMNGKVNGINSDTSSFGPPTHDQLLKGIDNAIKEFGGLKQENTTFKKIMRNLNDLRLHLGKTARGREQLNLFDRAKKGKK
jgi:hypothetical protein